MNGLTRILTAAAAVLAATLTTEANVTAEANVAAEATVMTKATATAEATAKAEAKPAAPLSSRTNNVRIAHIGVVQVPTAAVHAPRNVRSVGERGPQPWIFIRM